MKRVIYVLIVSAFAFGNSVSIQKDTTVKKTPKEEQVFEIWKREYRTVAFQRCLFLGYGRSEEVRALLKKDRSAQQDFPFGLPQYQFIDTIVQPIIAQAKRDSIAYYKMYLEGRNEIELNDLNGLPLIRCCLSFYESSELDSIATERVEQMDFLWTE